MLFPFSYLARIDGAVSTSNALKIHDCIMHQCTMHSIEVKPEKNNNEFSCSISSLTVLKIYHTV